MLFNNERNDEQEKEFEAQVIPQEVSIKQEEIVVVKTPRKLTYEDFVSLDTRKDKKKLDIFFIASIVLLSASILTIIILIILGNNKVI